MRKQIHSLLHLEYIKGNILVVLATKLSSGDGTPDADTWYVNYALRESSLAPKL
ncbi:MAG: hypothetical protein KAJ95_10355 [Gammaproteobacteria bacterium]|nr:hypothetical protein [Gammaproteobacteria bacterium]